MMASSAEGGGAGGGVPAAGDSDGMPLPATAPRA